MAVWRPISKKVVMALPSRRICEGDDEPPPPLLPPPPPPPPPPPQPPPPLRSALKRENMLIHGIRCVRYLDAQKRRRTIEVTNILVRSVLTMRQLFSRKVRRQKSNRRSRCRDTLAQQDQERDEATQWAGQAQQNRDTGRRRQHSD